MSAEPAPKNQSNGKAREMRLGDLLVERGLITKKRLDEALEEQRNTGQYIGQILLRRGYVSRVDLGRVLEEQLGVRYIDLSTYAIDPEVASLLSEKMIKDYLVLPVGRDKRRLHVAMADPMNLEAIQTMRLTTGLEIVPLFTTEMEIQQAIDQFFDVKQVAYQAIQDTAGKGILEEERSIQELEAMVEEAPVVRLVNSIITGAISAEASDIHLEPTSGDMQVRYRIDGMLHTQMTVPRRIQAAVISRVKIISGMDIAERRAPQDGRVSVTDKGREIDLRVSTLLTVNGEKVVMRVLDKGTVLRRLVDLGLLPDQLTIIEGLVTKPYGMILVTGPTGSGKTTTLYAILNRLNERTKNIVTIEDPVEYKVFGLNQVQVNPTAGISFAAGLRAILRQDPNIVLVGEIRDAETAQISIQAALTGHLVLSSLHTNDAPSAVARLLDMGIEPYLTSSSLVGVVAQRLARVICRECREPYEPPQEILDELQIERAGRTFYHGRGCKACNDTGYRGRMAVYEIMRMNEEIRRLTQARAPMSEIRRAAVAAGMKEMRQSGIEAVLSGQTTAEEILRVVYVEGE